MSKSIQLHCPSTKRTVGNFVISPFQTNEQIFHSIRLAFEIPYAALYTVDAKAITKLDSVQDDQRILVAASREERMLPDSLPGFEFYDGQEGNDVDLDLDGYGQSWETLSEREKCDHIMSLNDSKPTTRNQLRMTRQWQTVSADLDMIKTKTSNPAECEALIEQRWGMNIDHFLPEAMKPSKLKTSGKYWDAQVVAALSVMSSFTPGQARLAAEFLGEAVHLRLTDGVDTSPIIKFVDIINAVTIIYERAGVIPPKLTKAKSAKQREKERKKAFKEKMKGDAKSKGKGSGPAMGEE
jgi:hypothetical protein